MEPAWTLLTGQQESSVELDGCTRYASYTHKPQCHILTCNSRLEISTSVHRSLFYQGLDWNEQTYEHVNLRTFAATVNCSCRHVSSTACGAPLWRLCKYTVAAHCHIPPAGPNMQTPLTPYQCLFEVFKLQVSGTKSVMMRWVCMHL